PSAPGATARAPRKHGAPNRNGLSRLAVLLGRNAEEVARLDVPAIELDGARERVPGFRRELAITRRHQRLTEPRLALRRLAAEGKCIAPRFNGIFDASKPQIDRRDHLPAAAVVRIASEMAL